VCTSVESSLLVGLCSVPVEAMFTCQNACRFPLCSDNRNRGNENGRFVVFCSVNCCSDSDVVVGAGVRKVISVCVCC
jgi:hypothetical protein